MVNAPSFTGRSGHEIALTGYALPPGQRTSTQHADRGLLPVKNPGQPIFVNNSVTSARPTMRNGQATDVINVHAQAPGVPNRNITDHTARTTDRELTNYNDFGPAKSIYENNALEMKKDGLEQGRLGASTLREMTHTSYEGNPKAVGLEAPMSYEDVLKSEGYSLRSVEESDRMPGGERMNLMNDKNEWTRTELAEEPPNMSRDNNLQTSTKVNLHIVNKNLETNPNRQLQTLDRIDQSILQDNDLITEQRARFGSLTPEVHGVNTREEENAVHRRL